MQFNLEIVSLKNLIISSGALRLLNCIKKQEFYGILSNSSVWSYKIRLQHLSRNCSCFASSNSLVDQICSSISFSLLLVVSVLVLLPFVNCVCCCCYHMRNTSALQKRSRNSLPFFLLPVETKLWSIKCQKVSASHSEIQC